MTKGSVEMYQIGDDGPILSMTAIQQLWGFTDNQVEQINKAIKHNGACSIGDTLITASDFKPRSGVNLYSGTVTAVS